MGMLEKSLFSCFSSQEEIFSKHKLVFHSSQSKEKQKRGRAVLVNAQSYSSDTNTVTILKPDLSGSGMV
jgi:hypothetical protein